MIKCQECGKDVSPNAVSCPHCGKVFKVKKKSSILKKIGIVFAVIMGLSIIGNIINSENNGNSNNINEKLISAIEIDAEKLISIYASNEVSADSKYKGKILKITGFVHDIGKDFTDNSYITLGNKELRSVQCFFNKKHENEIGEISKSQYVTIIGKCDGLMMNVLINNSQIIGEGADVLEFLPYIDKELNKVVGQVDNELFITDTGKKYRYDINDTNTVNQISKYCSKKCKITIPDLNSDVIEKILLVEAVEQ